jgi:hypothetical protein
VGLAIYDQFVQFFVPQISLPGVFERAIEGATIIIFTIEIVSCHLSSLAVNLLRFANLTPRANLEIALDLLDLS